LDVVLTHIGIAVNFLIVDLLYEKGAFWLFPNFFTKAQIRGVNDVSPKASDQDVVTSSFLNKVKENVKNLPLCH
jgi:hypothetical protein